MNKQIFVNLPVKDLPRSKDFFAALGYTFNPQFTNDQGACMVISENIFTMLLTEEFFKTFLNRPLSSAHESAQVINCLSCESREEVDTTVAKAVAAGGATLREPQDMGFMYSHGFSDLDGHLWELVFMDPSAVPPQA
jgi:predicted lactoylglutathione lyase|eukprot:gene36445-44951_t